MRRLQVAAVVLIGIVGIANSVAIARNSKSIKARDIDDIKRGIAITARAVDAGGIGWITVSRPLRPDVAVRRQGQLVRDDRTFIDQLDRRRERETPTAQRRTQGEA